MTSMFVATPFSRFDLGRHILGNGIGLRQLTLAQGPSQTVLALEDYLDEIRKISDPEVRRRLEMKYQSCKEKGLISVEGIGCLASLSADIFEAIKNEGKTSRPPLPPPPGPAFPIIPVAVAVLAAGGLIWFLATKGKK